jgi:hypothetical protein
VYIFFAAGIHKHDHSPMLYVYPFSQHRKLLAQKIAKSSATAVIDLQNPHSGPQANVPSAVVEIESNASAAMSLQNPTRNRFHGRLAQVPPVVVATMDRRERFVLFVILVLVQLDCEVG